MFPECPGQRATEAFPGRPVAELPVLALWVIRAGAPLRADLKAGPSSFSGTRGCLGQGAGTWGDCQGCRAPERAAV